MISALGRNRRLLAACVAVGVACAAFIGLVGVSLNAGSAAEYPLDGMNGEQSFDTVLAVAGWIMVVAAVSIVVGAPFLWRLLRDRVGS